MNTMRTRYILSHACDTDRHGVCVHTIRATSPWRMRRMRGYERYVCACPCHAEDTNSPNYGRTA